MTIATYPWENQDTTETQYARIFRETQDPSVAGAEGSGALAASVTGSSRVVSLTDGRVFAAGRVMEVTGGTESVTVTAASASNRVDLIVARFDATGNGGSLAVLPGTSGSSTVPTPTQDEAGIWEVPLHEVDVIAGQASILSGNLRDVRVYATQGGISAFPTTGRPRSPRKWRVGVDSTLGRLIYWTGAAWAEAGRLIRFRDLIMPTTRADTPVDAPAYNLLDGARLTYSSSAPTASVPADQQDGDVHLQWLP